MANTTTEETKMTNAIEQAKRVLFDRLKYMKQFALHNSYGTERCTDLELAIENYLEITRQDHEALHETARARFEDTRKLEAANQELAEGLRLANENLVACAKHSAGEIVDLESRLAKMTEERDSIQLRLHAVDHAYKEQQDRMAIQVKDSRDHVSCEAVDANTGVIRTAVRSIQLVITDWGMGDLKAKKAMRQIARIVNGDGTVGAACGALEKDEACKVGEKDWREIAAEHEERNEAMKAKAEAERRKYRMQEVKINCAIAGVALGVNHALWSALAAPAKKETCQHSFFAIGDDQMKCTFCGVGK